MIQTILLLLILLLISYKYFKKCERFELEDPQKPFRNAVHNRFKDDINLIM